MSTIRIQALPKFPASVEAGDGILIERSGGVFTFSLDQSVSPTFTGNVTLTPESGTALTITPAAGTLDRGIDITQTGPSSGSVLGPTSFNLLDATYNSTTTGSVDPFFDHGAWQQWVAAWRVNMTIGGANLGGQPIGAGFYQLRNTTDTPWASDNIGLAGEAYSNANSPNAWFHGLVGAAILGAGANVAGMVGVFSENDIPVGAVVVQRRGFHSVNQGFVTATSDLDTAYDVASQDLGGSFKHLMTLDTSGGAPPLQATANLIWSNGAFTVANILKLDNLTVTGDILNFATVKLSAAGTSSWPIVAGGTAAGSTLTLESTTGAGTTDAINFRTGSQVHRGAINTSGQWTLGPNVTPGPGVKLTVSNNVSAPASSAGQTVTHVIGVDTANTVSLWDTFSTTSSPFLTLRKARGTAASFTATQSGDNLGFVGMIGATAANTFGNEAGGAGGVFLGAAATENWSATNQGAKFVIYTTAIGAAAVSQVAQFAGGFSVGNTTDPGAGAILANASIKSQGPTSGIGYATGAGGAVTQATSKSTGVTLNRVTGAITMTGAALTAATSVGFTLTNSAIAATDVVQVSIKSGASADSYAVTVDAVAAGSCRISLRNVSGGSLSEAVVLNFAVIKGVAS